MIKRDHVVKVQQRDGTMKPIATVSEEVGTSAADLNLYLLVEKITACQEAKKQGRPMPTFVIDAVAPPAPPAPPVEPGPPV